MNLDEALGHLTQPDTDEPTTHEALRAIDQHLGGDLTVAPGAVAVVIGREALELQCGAREVLGAMQTFVTGPVIARRRGATIRWISGPPPADVPIVLFARCIVTGATVRALLAEIPRLDEAVAVMVVAAAATSDGLAAITTTHPEVAIQFAATIDARAAL